MVGITVLGIVFSTLWACMATLDVLRSIFGDEE
jgi:hypothetical protein